MIIKTSDPKAIEPFIKKLYIPPPESHKGQNGKVLVIGGSGLFHAASIWSALTASYFVDMVHYASTIENNEVMTSLKKKFRGGIVIPREEILSYIEEDDAILVGPGLVRADGTSLKFKIENLKFEDILHLKDEAEFTYMLTHFLITRYPHKQFIFDAGALQMMETSWLSKLAKKSILTPHQVEFHTLFGQDLSKLSSDKKSDLVKKAAQEVNSIIHLKAVDDFVSDGQRVIQIVGGNSGLTKGGSGDILAGLITALSAKNDPFDASVVASYVLKRSAERLFLRYGYWYNIDSLIDELPKTLFDLYDRI